MDVLFNKVRCSIKLILVLGLMLCNIGVYAQEFTLSGTVDTKDTRELLAGATIKLYRQDHFERGTISDHKGVFVFESLPKSRYKIEFSYIGYKTKQLEIDLTKDTQLNISLEDMSSQLSEVVVTATESKSNSTSSLISKEAMEHIQPTSFKDVLSLLPGGKSSVPAMSSPQGIALRQAGSYGDDFSSAAMGTSFVIDGATLATDANMQYIQSLSSGSGDAESRNRFINQGVDMRSISTDDIESIEIIRGIPGASYGNITSGVVKVERVKKATPLSVRIKAEEYGQLVHAGKGVNLGGIAGQILNVDLDYLNSRSNPRAPMQSYERVTGSVRYSLPKEWDNYTLNSNANISVASNIGNEKKDPEVLTQPDDYYRTTYNRLQAGLRMQLYSKQQQAFSKLSFNSSIQQGFDKIEQSKFMQLQRTTAAPISDKEGVADAIILPMKYTADILVDGKPMNLQTGIDALFEFDSRIVDQKLTVGAEWTYAKNWGEGQVYDPMRPINPYSFSRAVPYNMTPAKNQLSFYVEDQLRATWGQNTITANIGARTTQILGLDSKYEMKGKVYIDPRVNIGWDYSLGESLDRAWGLDANLGLGRLTMMPSLLQLFPNPIYADYIQLNYYHANSDYRRINIRTYKVDPTNYDLKPARNNKWEIRMGSSWGGNRLSVTYFREYMKSGIRNDLMPAAYAFTKYDASGIDHGSLTAPPSLSDLPSSQVAELSGIGQYKNDSRLDKEGVEFQLSTERLPLIHTRLTVAGAWFKTKYYNSNPVFEANTNKNIDGVPVNNLYIGLYERERGSTKQMFNTNYTFDTYIQKLGLIFSTTFECNWFNSSQEIRPSARPTSYMDTTGKLHPYTDEDAKDIYKQWLIQSYRDELAIKQIDPFYMYINLKASKEFLKQKVRVSLFIDRILDYTPDYISEQSGLLIRRSAKPYFGMELTFKI